MVLVVLFAGILGSLVFAVLTFFGTTIWIATLAYFICCFSGIGLTFLTSMVVRSGLLPKMRLNIFGTQKNSWETDQFEPRPVPDLSEYLFSAHQKNR